MFGFPIGNGNAGFNDFVEKFTNNADSGFPKIQQREVFYSIKDGVWTDPTIWQTASGRVGLIPSSANDDVYVRHTINTSTGSGIITFFCNNLFNTGRINFIVVGGTPSTLTVFGNINSIGVLDMSISNLGHNLILCGTDNKILNLITGTGTSRITYARLGEQPILDIPYNGLNISNLVNGVNIGKKYPTNNIVCNYISIDNFSVLDLSYYNLTCNSTTIQSNIGGNAISGGFLFAAGSYITFKGPAGIINADLFFDENVTIEFQNGVLPNSMSIGRYRINNCTYKFTTNNQAIIFGSSATLYAENVIIDSNIILTCNTSVNFYINTSINGTNSLSKLTNAGNIYFRTQNAAQTAMSTGIYDFTTSANNIIYEGNYSATIPSYFTNFHNLSISGTGTKTLGVNTTLNGNLSISSSGNLQLSTFNLIVTGTSTLAGTGVIYPLQKSGAGSVTFIGALITSNNTYSFDFSAGNPSVEFRSSMTLTNQTATTIKTGTGTYTFSTNNQTITFVGNNIFQFEGLVNIGSALTLTISDGGGGGSNQTKQIVLNSASGINGLSAGSTLIIGNNTGLRINQPSTTIMSTGVFTPSTNSGSLFQINYTGNSTIPYTSFADLFISNIGIKTLSGNTTINNFINRNVTSSSQQLECSTFNLTINSTTTLGSPAGSTTYILSKSGSGNILFTGLITLENNSPRLIDFTGGNPSVELRGGISITSPSTTQVKTGTGTWSFTTNNQNITQLAGTGTLQFDTSILISGAITLSQVNSSASAFTLISTGTINGNNASSTFAMGTASGTNTLNYQSATQPMATGVLNTSTNLNTWIYGLNNQDIKGSPTTSPKQVYRNLTLNGTGVKTLQGYVSVQNTYTLTAPATLALNGFTLTNP